MKKLLRALLLTTLPIYLIACNDGGHPNSPQQTEASKQILNSAHRLGSSTGFGSYTYFGPLKVCMVNGDTSPHSIAADGYALNKPLLPGQIYCVNVPGQRDFQITSDNTSINVKYTKPQGDPNIWDFIKNMINAFMILKQAVEMSGGINMDVWTQSLKSGDISSLLPPAAMKWIGNYTDTMSNPSGMYSVLAGDTQPQTNNTKLFMLAAIDKNREPGNKNPFEWNIPGSYTTGSGQTADQIYAWTADKSGSVIGASVVDYIPYSPQGSGSNLGGTAPMDGIYVCMTNSQNAGLCNKNQNSLSMHYNDDSGKTGDIEVFNETNQPNIFSIQDSATASNSITSTIVAPYSNYIFREADIEKANFSSGKFTVMALTNVAPGAQQTNSAPYLAPILPATPYDKTWATQKIQFNYFFAGELPLYTGPYKATLMSSDQLANFSSSPWQKIAYMSDFFSYNKANKPRIGGWVTNWSSYHDFNMATDLDPRIDDIYYAFFVTDPQGNMTSADPWSDFLYNGKPSPSADNYSLGNFDAVLASGKGVWMGLGGYNDAESMTTALSSPTTTSTMASTSILLRQFAENEAMNIGIYNKVYGYNIDWEPTSNSWDVSKAQLKNLISLCDQLSADRHVSISITGNPVVYAKVDALWANDGGKSFWETLSDHVAFINIMSYDYHSPLYGEDQEVKQTSFSSPLYPDPKQPLDAKQNFAKYNVDSAVQYLSKTDNVPVTKIVMGVPAYGYMYTSNSKFDQAQPFQSFDGSDSDYLSKWLGTENAEMTYKQIIQSTDQNIAPIFWFANPTYNDLAAQNIITGNDFANPQNNVFITYDNNVSAQAKMGYAVKNNLNSVMVWSMDGDISASKQDKRSIINGLVQGAN